MPSNVNKRPRASRLPARDAEHREQTALVRWAALHARRWPALALLYAIPNGGHRHPTVAAKMRAEGQMPGAPDLCLPVSRCGYPALYVEMKTPRGRLSPEQRDVLALLRAEGNAACVCRTWTDAADLLTAYLTGDVRTVEAALFTPPPDACEPEKT